MRLMCYACPICGGTIELDADNKDTPKNIVIIKNKRKRTDVVHLNCMKQFARKEQNQ